MARYEHSRNIVGDGIRKMRVERGLSQPQLAAKCQMLGWDISRDVIASIEGRGRIVADFELLILAHILGASVSSFYPVEVKWSATGVPKIAANDPEGVKVALGIRFIADESKE